MMHHLACASRVTGGLELCDCRTAPVPPVLKIQQPGTKLPADDDSARRKRAPIGTGVLDYFPDALWQMAELSYWGNEKHNPGEPLHDARSKSNDDADCLQRHFMSRGTWDSMTLKDGRVVKVRHSVAMAWRACRIAQIEIENDVPEGEYGMARGARP
jgi:hypothetical protein